jgi:putative oxidoreductase
MPERRARFPAPLVRRDPARLDCEDTHRGEDDDVGFLQPYQAQIYALFRVVFGLLFLMHGVQKLMAGGPPPQMPAPMFWTAALIETVGGGLVLLGLFAAPAAFVCSGMMAVAYFMVHQPQGLWPLQNQNGGELAILYCWAFLLVAAKGSGTWSVDAARGGSA